MKVVDLHPEDLLDKDADGELTAHERTLLDAHLVRCSTCRFEREVRADFARELADDDSFGASGGGDHDSFTPPPLADPEIATRAPLSAGSSSTNSNSSARSSRRRAVRILLLVAAALFVGGAATAGVGGRVWAQIAAVLSDEPGATAAEPNKEAPAPHPIHAGTSAVVASHHADAPPIVVDDTAAPPSSAVPSAAVVAATDPPVESAASIFDSANEARRQGDYARAIALHRRLQRSHSASREAHVSHATVGRLLLDRGDASAALASFDAYQARGSGAAAMPSMPSIDEAVMVGRATALERLGRSDEARNAWRSLLVSFPDTPYAEHARSRASSVTATTSPP